jgi:Phosphodiester glycosidase
VLLHSQPVRSNRSRPECCEQLRLTLDDGARTTAHVAIHPLASTALRIKRLPGLARLEPWCAENDVSEALVGGFYLRRPGLPDEGEPPLSATPLGELWLDGARQPFVPFTHPYGQRRACVSVVGDEVQIARRDELPEQPAGDLLQAGPLLVRDGRALHGDEEEFSANADQFDSDITAGRHPRAALGCDGERLIALACDGRADDDAGLTIEELADTMVALGARQALNLDGGGSTSLVSAGRLRNSPREAHGVPVAGGRAVATALVFIGR